MTDLIYYTCTDQRCEQSQVEQEIIGKLQDLGIPVVPQVKLGQNWVFDGAVNGTRLIIEIHGDYWHTRPEVQERDGRKQQWADQNNYLILVIWEADYRKDPETELLKAMEVYERAKAATELADAVMDTLKGDKGDTRSARRSDYGTWRDAFLTKLAETGIVLDACEAADISRKTAYQHRDEDPDFKQDWKLALQDAADRALREYRKRALQQSDRAMEFFIRTRDPEGSAEHSTLEVTGKDGGPIEVQLTDAERVAGVTALLDRARARRAGSAPDEGAA